MTRPSDVPARTWGPVITAIDSGHAAKGGSGRCGVCGTKMPCAPMRKAVREQRAYADELAQRERHERALALTDVTVPRGLFAR